MKIENNHLYFGNIDRLTSWIKTEDNSEITDLDEKQLNLVIERIRVLIKNYLQLDNVNFLFGTGSSIHLGAAGIQNIPKQMEDDIKVCVDQDIKDDFKEYIIRLQKSVVENERPELNHIFKDDRDWDVIFDGTYVRNYEKELKLCEGEVDSPEKHYGEISVMLEELLNYLTSIAFQRQAEHKKDDEVRINKLINFLKQSLFNICDLHERATSESNLKRIKDKGFEETFKANKYIFHEKFLKSLMQRPLNLQRANIFTSNYDLAFEYAFDNLGIKYLDGFSGFHHRYFKPETFNYDIFYPGTTTVGKIQRIEKVVRYFKLHGSLSWVKDKKKRKASNIYGIEELPIELIKRRIASGDTDFDYGNVIIYPTSVKKSYTLDLPYSELFRHFAYCTSLPQTVLFTIGYSFCDDHFNDIIYQALTNPSFTLIIVDFNGSLKSKEIKKLKELNDPRIIILEGDYFGDFLTFADSLMPDFFDKSSDDKVANTINALISSES